MKPEITQSEVKIYFSKFYNYYQFIGYLIAMIVSIGIFYVFFETFSRDKNYLAGVFALVLFGYSLYKLYYEFQDISNSNPQLIISKGGIELAKKGNYIWPDIEKIEAWTTTGKGTTKYLDLTLNNGEKVSIEIDDLDVNEKELNQFIQQYKLSSSFKYDHNHPVSLKLLHDPDLENYYNLSEVQSDKFRKELSQFIKDDFEEVKKLSTDLKVDEFGPISLVYETIAEFHPDKHEFLISEIRRIYTSSRDTSDPSSRIGVFDGILYENFSMENLNMLVDFYTKELKSDQVYFVHHALLKFEELSDDLKNQLPRKTMDEIFDLLVHEHWKVRVKAHEILTKFDPTFNNTLSFLDKLRVGIFNINNF